MAPTLQLFLICFNATLFIYILNWLTRYLISLDQTTPQANVSKTSTHQRGEPSRTPYLYCLSEAQMRQA